MLREVAYERILKRQRSSFHAVAAGWLIQQNSERLSEFGGLIAEHYELAGQPEQALLYLRQAGERAAANFANREAARYFTRALSLLHPEDTRTRFELLAAQERVFDLQGAREAQAKDLETMEVLTEELSDDALRSESALRKANFARRIGDYAKASSAARDALAFAESCADISRQAESRLQLGAVLMLTGDYPAAESEFEQALALVRNAKNALSLDVEHSADLTGKLVHIEASSLRGLGLVAYRREEYEPARTYQLQSLALCREINDRRGEGLTLTNLGNAHAAVSDFSAARTCHEQALCVTREIGDRQAESKVLNNVGSVCIAQGDYPSARKYLERSLSIKREVGDRPGESTTLANLGAVARDQGDLEEALSFFQRAIDIRRAYHDRGGETMAMAGLASVLQALGDYGQAKRYGDEAVRIAVELHDKEDECYIKAQLGLLYHEIGDNDKAQALATQTIAAARSIGTREGEAAGLMCLGHAFAEHQQWEESTRAYQEALAIRRALGQHYLVTDALAGLARVSLQSGAPAEALGHVEQILSFLETGTLIGVSQSFRVRLTCYEVLHANNDQRAHLVLRTAYNLLLDRAERINDPELKRSFLETVPYNREIIDTYRRVATKA
jgi:tetratricopeptide (TPR) repeat protein